MSLKEIDGNIPSRNLTDVLMNDYLNYFNNYLTVAAWALDHSLDVDYASEYIEMARDVYYREKGRENS